MTPFGDMLSDQEITRTAAYVQQLAGRRADATMAAAGKKVFDMHCVACHGPDGTGNIHLGAPDLTAGVYTYGGDLNTIRTTIRSGDRKSTRLNSSHVAISYAVFCFKKNNTSAYII